MTTITSRLAIEPLVTPKSRAQSAIGSDSIARQFVDGLPVPIVGVVEAEPPDRRQR